MNIDEPGSIYVKSWYGIQWQAIMLTCGQSSSSIDRCAHTQCHAHGPGLSPMTSCHCFHHLLVIEIDIFIYIYFVGVNRVYFVQSLEQK